MTEHDPAQIRRIVREELRDVAHSNGDDVKLAAHLQLIDDTLSRNTLEVARLADRVGTQNHRLDKLEIENVRADAKREERKEWEEKQAAGLKWMFGAGLAAAGVISGIVFGVLDRLNP